MDAAQSTLFLQQKRIQAQHRQLHQQQQQQQTMARPSANAHQASSTNLEGDADVDVGLNQWAGGPSQGAEEVTANAEAAVGEEEEEEEEEEESEVLEEDDPNAMFGRQDWDPQNDRVDLPPGEVIDDPEEEEEEKSEDAYDDYDQMLDSDTPTETITWIKWFCSLPGHEFFAEVDEDFIEDDFNLTGLSQVVPFYKEALEMILDVETADDSHKIPDVSIIESSAELLYGLIHQRYITTRRGLQQMLDKFEAVHFGACPRVFCHMQPVLPCGRSDLPGLETVKLYCPNCMDCYQPPSSRFAGVDGAYFGTTFPHLFLQTYREHEPLPIAIPSGSKSSAAASASADAVPSSQTSSSSIPGGNADGTGANAAYVAAMTPPPGGVLDANLLGAKAPQTRLYTPRIYGFKVSEHAKSGPRMRWMRMRPTSLADLEREGLPAPPPAGPSTSIANQLASGSSALTAAPEASGTTRQHAAVADGLDAAVPAASASQPSANASSSKAAIS